MKISTKSAGAWGTVFVIATIVLFLGYWYYLLEPLQLKILEANETPSIINTIGRSLIVGTLLSLFSYFSQAFLSYKADKPGSEYIKFKDIVTHKVFWKWFGLWNFTFLLFSLFWHYGNF